MITLDTGTLQSRALNIQGCYMVGINDHNVKRVLLNGCDNHSVFYCDVNSGFAVLNKRDLSGKVIVSGDDLIYDVFFGKVEVILDGMEKRPD